MRLIKGKLERSKRVTNAVMSERKPKGERVHIKLSCGANKDEKEETR